LLVVGEDYTKRQTQSTALDQATHKQPNFQPSATAKALVGCAILLIATRFYRKPPSKASATMISVSIYKKCMLCGIMVMLRLC